MQWFGLHGVEPHGVTFQNVMAHGELFTAVSVNASIVKAHQHSAGAKKGGLQAR